jgi:hypothetical protein
MQVMKRIRTRSGLQGGAVILVAALVLSSCGTSRSGVTSPQPHVTPIATQNIAPTSLCANGGDYVQQSLNGNFTGCFRVPVLHSASLLVALQAYVNGKVAPSHVTTTTVGSPLPANDLSLKLSAKSVTPGETVTIYGHLSKQLPSPRETFVNVCWDGCVTGLQEGGSQLHWTSPTNFRTKLQVPKTAWLVSNHGVIGVHPLRAGNYQVGVQCIGVISGCAYSHANAQATVTLRAPAPQRCVKNKPCETLHLSTARAKVGSIVTIRGWAPLQSILGQAFGWQYSITKGSVKRTYPALTYSDNPKGGGFNVVLTPRALHVVAGVTWAVLGKIPYLSSTFAGPSPIQPSTNSKRVAWCQTSELQITGGASPIDIPTHTVATALRPTPLRLFSSSTTNPACSTVMLDPTYHDSIYAGFDTAANNSAPPIYIAGLYTTNNGASWQAVPTPAGYTVEDFAGFTTDGRRVAALFAGENSYNSRHSAPGTNNGSVPAEVSSNGGATWTSTSLGCPSSGPCTTFGPYQWGNCAMNGSEQPLLEGPTDSTATSGVKWTDTSWSSTVNSCFSQQLVVSTTRNLLLLDSTSQYMLQESTNSGRTWSYVALPQISAANYGGQFTPLNNTLLFAPDGSLFAVVQPASSERVDLYRLYPGKSSWCQVPNVFPGQYSNASIGPLRIAGTDLLWSKLVYPGADGGTSTSSEHEMPLTNLHC